VKASEFLVNELIKLDKGVVCVEEIYSRCLDASCHRLFCNMQDGDKKIIVSLAKKECVSHNEENSSGLSITIN
jgi:hypothetical protein